MQDPRAALAGRRLATQRRLAALTGDFEGVVAASRDSNADDEHDPEGATIAWERSQVGALIREAEAQLAEIDAALLRIGSDEYGVCERCAEPIPAERLEARPAARRCVGCASRP
jgi:DnaK suppressor protein